MSGSSDSKSSWQNVTLRVIASTATHPLELAKFLIQIGHEPIVPYHTKTLFGRPTLALPNVFQYLRHIKQIDGLAGCYRGLALKLTSQTVFYYAQHCTSEVLKAHEIFTNEPIQNNKKDITQNEDSVDDSEEEEDNEDGIYDEELPIAQRRNRFLKQLGFKLSCRSVAIIVSQPFQVAAFRAMAQFVGRETKYQGTVGAVVSVYRESGICGFWSGLTPRLVGEISAITVSSSLIFLVRSYLSQDRTLNNLVSAVMGFLASTVTYPFHVVASCMAIKGSSLRAAEPPQMPATYTNWVACLTHLRAEGQWMRGSSLLWRYYTGPQVIIGNRAIPLEPFKPAKY
ncbi:mitochondrial carrier homolog 2-like isoform X2 [Neocloeon triangulifer]|nr:mitochondrial carrier homolog 2-like isoform X2 [Neocloeon triangulifer]